MSRIITALIATLLASQAWAQIQLDLVTEKGVFVPGEELRVGVRIGNVSGQTLRFEESKDWVSFMFDPNDKVRVRQLGDIPVEKAFTVKSATRATRWFDLAPYFDITTPGTYTLNAVVQVKDWSEERVAAPIKIEIASPSTVWEQRFGVPLKPGQTGTPEIRKYILQRTMTLEGSRLYVRVTDASEQKTFRVTALDQLLQMNDPIRQMIDQRSRLHVLHRSARASFTYTVFEPDGEMVIRQRHDFNEITGSRPSLSAAENGDVIIFGGVRKLTRTDVPPAERDLSK